MAEHRVKCPLPRMAGYGRNQDPAPFSFYNSRCSGSHCESPVLKTKYTQVEGYFLTRKGNEHLITKKLHLSTAHLNGWLWSSHQTISQCQFQNSESL